MILIPGEPLEGFYSCYDTDLPIEICLGKCLKCGKPVFQDEPHLTRDEGVTHKDCPLQLVGKTADKQEL